MARRLANLFHLAVGSAADLANRASLCGLGAGSFYIAINPCMFAGGRNLSCLSRITGGAVISGFTGLAAGGLGDYLNQLPVVASRDRLVLGSAAVSAGVLANTGGGAGCRFQSTVQHIVVCIRISRNNGRLLHNLTTDGAYLAAGGAFLGAGSSNLFHGSLSMTGGRCQLAQVGALHDLTADGALHNGLAVFGAGGLNHLGITGSMAQSRHFLGVAVAADGAGIGGLANFRAGGLFGQLCLILVAVGLTNFFHLAVGSAADLTNRASLCGLGAGSFYIAIYPRMRAGGRNLSCLSRVTDGADISACTSLAAGGLGDYLNQLPAVASGNRHVLGCAAVNAGILTNTGGSTGCVLQGTEFIFVLAAFSHIRSECRSLEKREHHRQYQEDR